MESAPAMGSDKETARRFRGPVEAVIRRLRIFSSTRKMQEESAKRASCRVSNMLCINFRIVVFLSYSRHVWQDRLQAISGL